MPSLVNCATAGLYTHVSCVSVIHPQTCATYLYTCISPYLRISSDHLEDNNERPSI